MKGRLVDRIGNFTTIPNSVIAMWPTLGVDALALFVYLRYRTNRESEVAFPSYSTIRTETRLTRQRISKAILSLEEAGLVERKKRFGASTIYSLTLPVVRQVDYSSSDVELSVVQVSHTNKTDLNQTDLPRKEHAPSRARTNPELTAFDALFSELTGLPIPSPKTVNERKAEATRWYQPVRQMVELANGQSGDILREAVAKMKREGWQISGPRSVVKTFTALYAAHKTEPAAHTYIEAD